MCLQKRASSPMAAILVFMFSLGSMGYAKGGAVRKGKLVIANLTISSDIPGLDRPPCKAPPCNTPIPDLEANLGVTKLSQIGIVVTTVDGDLDLRAFALEIRSNNRVIFATQPINEALKASSTGYLFMLDGNAVQAGSKFFVAENTLAFTAKTSGKGAASVTYSLVNAEGAKPRGAGSNPNKQPLDTQKVKPEF